MTPWCPIKNIPEFSKFSKCYNISNMNTNWKLPIWVAETIQYLTDCISIMCFREICFLSNVQDHTWQTGTNSSATCRNSE